MKHTESVIRLWGLGSPLESIRHTQNEVFSARLRHQDVIVRLTNADRRSRTQITGELEWMHFLQQQGVRVSDAIPSLNGRKVETVQSEGGTVHAVVFSKQPGNACDEIETVSDEQAYRWGSELGRMHRLSAPFEFTRGARPHLCDPGVSSLPFHAAQLLAASHVAPSHVAPSHVAELATWITTLPKQAPAYGLVHGDFHLSNFHTHEGVVYPFDFDDCGYHWRLADVAHPLYSLFFHCTTRGIDLAVYRRVKSSLTAGYAAEFPAVQLEMATLNRFIRARVALLYCWVRNTDQVPSWLDISTDAWRRRCLAWSERYLDYDDF